MKKLASLLTLLISLTTVGQDIHFTQFREAPLMMNPAEAGFYRGYERFILNHKSQWTSLGSPYRTTSASFDLPFWIANEDRAYLGAGLTFYNDIAGDSKFGTNMGMLSLNGIVPISRNSRFAAGVQVGVGQRSAKIESLTWGSQFDPSMNDGGGGFNGEIGSGEVNGLNSFMYADIGAGMKYAYQNNAEVLDGYDNTVIEVGAALFHINKPTLKYTSSTNDQIPLKMMFNTQMRFDVPGSTVSICPMGFYAKQGEFQEIVGGTYFRFETQAGTKSTGLLRESAIYFGAQVRVGDAFSPLFLLQFGDYQFGASYDFTYSDISQYSAAAGGFEIVLKYQTHKTALWDRKSYGSRW
jgi:type IX secretion system PorP/SprF family membrane protein